MVTMKRVLLHAACHTVALGLIIAGAVTGYIYFVPVGFLFEIVFWFYVLSLARRRKEARMSFAGKYAEEPLTRPVIRRGDLSRRER